MFVSRTWHVVHFPLILYTRFSSTSIVPKVIRFAWSCRDLSHGTLWLDSMRNLPTHCIKAREGQFLHGLMTWPVEWSLCPCYWWAFRYISNQCKTALPWEGVYGRMLDLSTRSSTEASSNIKKNLHDCINIGSFIRAWFVHTLSEVLRWVAM